jgi:hypothetical protein
MYNPWAIAAGIRIVTGAIRLTKLFPWTSIAPLHLDRPWRLLARLQPRHGAGRGLLRANDVADLSRTSRIADLSATPMVLINKSAND